MFFASITEFGAVSAGYRRVLDDLRRRQERLSPLLEPERLLVGTLGTTDLVEILLFDSFFPLSEVGGSVAHAFRRAIGAWCPQPGDPLPAPPPGQGVDAGAEATLVCAQDIAREDPSRPFLGVIYAKASPVAHLCLPIAGEPGGQVMSHALVRHFLDPAAGAWTQDLGLYLRLALGEHPLPEGCPRVLVCPLGGLDSVDLVVLLRAARLEQIGAAAWALRRQGLGTLWPAAQFGTAIENGRMLGHLGPEDQSVHWDHTPLFHSTSTTLGVPVRQRPSRPEEAHLVGRYAAEDPGPWWVWECPRGDTRPAAGELAMLVRYRFQPGYFRNLSSDAAGAPSSGALLQLFGQRDALAYNRNILQEPGGIRPVRTYSVDELLGFMSGLTGSASSPHPHGINSITELALVVHNPEALREHMPTSHLVERFYGRVHAVREFHLLRRPDGYPGPWIGTWLQGAKVAGLSYPVTNGVLNLIASVLDYLDEDLEGFLDLLPPLQLLVDWADAYRRQAGVDRVLDRPLTDSDYANWAREIWDHARDQPLPPQLQSAAAFSRFHDSLEQLATFRGRRDHPLRAPQGTLAFEGHAGYRVSRDAFSTYVKSLAAAFRPTGRDTLGRFIILDSATGRPTCQTDSGGTAIVRVSAMAVHHPIHWVFGHEIAHASFSLVPVNSRPELYRTGHALAQAAGLNLKQLKGTVAQLLSAVSDSLWDEFAADDASPFCRAAADVLTEVAADLLEWRSLQLEGDGSDAAAARFWFVTGPGLVHGLRDIYGSAPVGLRRISRLFLRVYFVSRFIQRRMAPEAWREDLQDLCEWLFNLREEMSERTRDLPLDRMADQDLIERLRCLKEDLDIPDEPWHTAVVNFVLDHSITSGPEDADHAQYQRVQAVIDAWIPFVEALLNLAPPPAPTDGDPRGLYATYLDRLMALEGWEVCRPWPQIIPGHPDEGSFHTPDTRRRSRRRPEFSTPAVSSRGGVMLASAERRRAYHELTLDCILRLEDLSRLRRREILTRYLDHGERGIRSSTRR